MGSFDLRCENVTALSDPIGRCASSGSPVGIISVKPLAAVLQPIKGSDKFVGSGHYSVCSNSL